jgi:signal peptidase I
LKEQVEGKTKKKKSALSFAIEFFIKIAVTALVVAGLVIFVVGIYVNHSNSCYPMIKDGDLVITYKLNTKYALDDEIGYLHDGKIKFGRIVARTGDVVDIREETLTVNGYGVYENAVYPTTAEGATIEFPYTVPADTVFVLNDYRSDPTDSRIYGGIRIADTKGKVFLLLRRRGF